LYKIDLSKREHIYDVSAECSKAVRSLLGDDTAYVTMLINNAGIVTGQKLLECKDRLMSLTMDVNATAHFWTLKSFLPNMLQHNKGHVVTIASGAGLTGAAGLVDYCASKHAAVGLTESILMEIYQQNRNVDVTLVCPYFISTGMFKGVKNKYQWLMPIIEPQDMANRIVKGILTNEYQILYPRIFGLMIFLKGFFPVKTYSRDKIKKNRIFGTIFKRL
jgi:all-trans-retinol dehydrogenase (NAD+)